MSMFCHGKFAVKTRAGKEDVVKDCEKRMLEAEIRKAARLYYNANGDKHEQMAILTKLSVKFLESGRTHDQLDALVNER